MDSLDDVEVRVQLPYTSAAPGLARAAVRTALARWGRSELSDDVELAVSELVTNAVLHAGSGPVLTLRAYADGVRVEVADAAQRLPTAREYGEDSGTGRGLHLVDGLARSWGAEPTPAGKVVWAIFGAGAHDTA